MAKKINDDELEVIHGGGMLIDNSDQDRRRGIIVTPPGEPNPIAAPVEEELANDSEGGDNTGFDRD